MAIYSKLNASLNEATEVIASIHEQEEKKRLWRPVGEVMQSVWLDLMLPIVREHPDLDPDKGERDRS